MSESSRKPYDELKRSVSENNFQVDDTGFSLPHMGQYYESYADESYMKALDEAIRGVENGNNEMAGFYTGRPYSTLQDLGTYNQEGVYFLKGKPDVSDEAEARGDFDGDTLYFDLDTLVADKGTIDNLKNTFQKNLDMLDIQNVREGEGVKSPRLGLRFLGMNAPETPKYSLEQVDLSKEEVKMIWEKDLKGEAIKDHLYERGATRKNGKVYFIKMKNQWREYDVVSTTKDLKPGVTSIKLLITEGESMPSKLEAGMKAKKLVRELIQKAGGEVYMVMDKTSLTRSSNRYPTRYGATRFDNDIIGKLKYFYQQIKDYNRHRYAGYSLWGQDAYGRYLGTAYAVIPGRDGEPEWVNISKYLIAQVPEITVYPDYTDSPMAEDNFGFASKVFQLHTYDFKARILADIVGSMSKIFDSRKKIQQWIFGKSFDSLKEWTLTIGDVTLFVPPTSIRSITTSTNEKIPAIRAKGSIMKGAVKSERSLEIKLYFNDDRGINGFPYEAKLPNGESITYHMNGLRAMISQFKFTPFLPIENTYINEVLNIEAVSMTNFQISTMPDYPRCIIGTLTLQEFDYRQYMPELPESTDENGLFRNAFSSTINYDVMRWYYQRPLILGETLKNVAPNSVEYLEKTFGHRTALQPMSFISPKVKFFMANEAHLQKMLQVKLSMMRSPNEKIILSEVEKKLAKDMSKIYKRLTAVLSDKEVIDALELINTGDGEMVSYYYDFYSNKKLKDENAQYLSEEFSPFVRVAKGEEENTVVVGEVEIYRKIEKALVKIQAEVTKANLDIGNQFLMSPRLVFRAEETKIESNGSKASKVIAGLTFKIDAPYITSDAIIEDIRRDASSTTQILKDELFNERMLMIPLSARFISGPKAPKGPHGVDIEKEMMFLESGSPGLRFDVAHPDIQFLAYCNMISNTLEMNDNETINEEAAKLKQHGDMEALETISYDPYEIGDVRITSLAASMSNTLTRFGLNGREAYAPQYMGGQDVAIEITLETKDLMSVGMIQAIPRLSAQYARDYRLIIPASPLKIDSEITRMLGVNEVLVETLDINTVPGSPGLFTIAMRLISIDRTLRNREGLKKINEFAIFGKNPDKANNNTEIRSYFQLSAALAEAEIYPDLELPKLEDLARTGYEFIRHKLDARRVYPDPDFYFVYGHVMQSQIFRETVANFVQTDIGMTKWKDAHGGEITTSTVKDYAISVDGTNEVADTQKKDIEQAEKLKETAEENVETYEEKAIKAINTLNASQSFMKWEISENISPLFLEEEYRALLKDYESSKNSPVVDENGTPGKWVYEALDNSRKASEMIKEYLKNTPPISIGTKDGEFKKGINRALKEIFKDETIREALALINVSVDEERFQKSLANILYASAAAASSEKEYTGKKKDASWKPDSIVYAVKRKGQQDFTAEEKIKDVEDAAKNGFEIGPYRIKMHKREIIREVTGKYPERKLTPNEGVNGSLFFLDPYFRKSSTTLAQIEDHKRKLIDAEYSTVAMFRNILFWIAKLIDDNVLPNMTHDVMSQSFLEDLETAVSKKTGNTTDSVEIKDIKKYIKFLKGSDKSADAGKMFTAAILTMSYDENLYKMISNGDYGKLNAMVEESTSIQGLRNIEGKEGIMFRKFLLALVGTGEIEKSTNIGQESQTPVTEYKKAMYEMKYIEAAEDPNIYVQHSFFDMVVNDKRGRMLRAFPTFYIVFVDEGRDIGMWKLHDNFYNINSVGEIHVAKSRKIAADTCRITLSNLFHTFTTEDEDLQTSFEYDYRDVFDSIFNTKAVALREEAKRLKQQPMNRAKLQGGTRIHVRMGYGADASNLPVVFNGTIAEISAGEAVEIVAQGDGIELLNPIYDNTEAHERENSDNWYKGIQNLFEFGSSPKEILDAFLTKEGGVIKKAIKNFNDGAFYDGHPLGISHFGSKDYKVLYKTGEITQNIYEAMSKPMWSELDSALIEQYGTDEAPRISMEVYGKNFWDILNACTSVSPDFVCGIAPFGFRSTIFHGAPRYYYAYEYTVDETGMVLEKRKPYQQFHIYTSYSDIIKNEIKASSKELKTNAQGLYSVAKILGSDAQKRVGPLWVDWDIYPEFQKSVIFDTQFLSKGVPFVRGITSWIADDKGLMQSAEKLAWRMTASLLKDSVKDMYQGEMLIIGDPTVKPHDRFYIHDTYEDMSGSALVEGVVHQFSAETGFVTSVLPDCIAVVDDKHEMAIQSIAGQVTSAGVITYLGVVGGTMAMAGAKNPLSTLAVKSLGKMVGNVGKGMSKVNMVKTADKILDISKAMKSGTGLALLGGATATLPGALILAALEMGTVYIIGKAVTETITREMKNKQVLQVFPLKKNQEVMTSGLSGHMGLVYGSPTYNIPGTYDKLFAALDTETNGFNSTINNVIEFLVPKAIQAQAKKFGEISTRGYDESGHLDASYQNMLKGIASSEGRRQSYLQRMLLVPRITPKSDSFQSDFEKFFGNSAFLDTNVIELQPEISARTKFINSDEEMKEFFSTGLVKMVWDMPLDAETYESKQMFVNGKREQIRALKVTRGSQKILDIPFLREEALEVMKSIIKKAKAMMPTPDPEITEGASLPDFIMVQSALKIGDTDTVASTGYSFVLEAAGTNKDKILRLAAESTQVELKEILALSGGTGDEVFRVDASPSNPAQIAVTVYPPATIN